MCGKFILKSFHPKSSGGRTVPELEPSFVVAKGRIALGNLKQTESFSFTGLV